tara:strand:+ start:677 stop:1756 length:1080 start_codon:yes stop_codon:yes gene_type:complete
MYKRIGFLVGVLIALQACVNPLTVRPQYTPRAPSHPIELVDAMPSPDGTLILFEYRDMRLSANWRGMGLLNWRTNEMTRIPPPPGQQFMQASFSDNGQQLAVGIGVRGSLSPREIGVLNLQTMQFTPVTHQQINGLPEFPIFQPGTNNIVYIHDDFMRKRLVHLDRLNNQVHPLMNEKIGGFLTLERPSFVARNELVFTARAPKNIKLKQRTEAITSDTNNVIAYRLRFGSPPQVLSPQDEANKAYKGFGEGAFTDLSSSRNGKIMTFYRVSPARPYNEQGKIISELYIRQNGQDIQLTNQESRVLNTAISYDGSTIAFLADFDVPRQANLYIYDMNTGQVTATHLLGRILTNPSFSGR